MASSGVKISRLDPFEHNPCGTIWYKNENTFGHQLLSKMGWSKGKGLGRNEDGIKENITILKKDNNSGIGYKNDANIAVGCLEYENILSKLRHHFKKDETKWNVDSLEQRSQNSTSRLHYRRFVRGKDLYRYSEKDMKCIFLDNPQESINSDSEKTEDTTFNSQMNMKEYFALKMKQRFGNLPKSNSEEESNSPMDRQQNCSSDPVPTKKRKRRRKCKLMKRIKLECEEILDEISNATNGMNTSEEESREFNISGVTYSVKKKDLSHEKVKSEKKKVGKLKNLKSCLKSKSTYHLSTKKNVSFDDEIHFKIFDADMEENNIVDNDIPVEFHATSVSDVQEYKNNQEIYIPRLINNSNCMENDFEVSDNQLDSFTLNKEKLRDIVPFEEHLPQCFDLPENSGPNFKPWLESQRQAMKMKLYRGMIKKLQKDSVLCTSNIVDIKGYGNWG